MNLTAEAPHWLALILIALLAAASIEDAVRLRISNLISAAILAGAVAAAIIVGPELSLWQNVAVFVGLLVIGTAVFALGMMGGGDIKLLAATGLWFDLPGAFLMIMSVLIAGGLLALLLLAARLIGWSDATRERIVVLKRRGGIPYGIAIAGGATLALSIARGWG